MSFYPKDLDEEALKQRVANDFFAKFTYEPLKKIDFALTQKDDVLNIHYLLWAEAKKGDKASIDESFVQLILTIGVQKLHKNYNTPEFLGAFDCEKIAFLPYKFIKDFLYRADFNWKIITPTKYQSDEFQKMLALTKDIFKEHQITFDFEKDNKDLKKFIKSSIAKGEYNRIEIDKDNFDEVYHKWISKVLPNINLKSEVWKKARKENIALEQDFFLADLISENNVSLNENLRILLQKRQDNKLYYEVKTKLSALFPGQYDLLDIGFINKDAHNDFWKRYKRPPAEKFRSEILERRDKLAPQDIMERKGAFYTPKIWAQKAQSYLESVLGKDWQDYYYIWDCAAGTGNLLKGLKNSAKIYASTLDLSDVLIMKELVKDDEKDKSKPAEQRLNLLEKHIFQFDFLNDDFSKLPQNLQDILNDEKKRQKLIIFINPPYAEVSSNLYKGKTGVNLSSTHTKYKDILQTAGRELFAQFFIRIYKEIPNCILASFSTLKYINGSAFANFRKEFKAQFLKGFGVPADTFDNVKGQFPIGFLIWNLKEKRDLTQIQLDIFERGDKFIRQKGFYKFNKSDFINTWISQFKNDNLEKLGWLAGTNGNDFQQNSIVYILNSKEQMANPRGIWINLTNLFVVCIYFSVRHAIEMTWLNNRDQFLYPNDKWQKDTEFQNDCLSFTLFHGQNRISTEISRGGGGENFINHFIPFLAKDQVSAKDSFASDFMFEFINGKSDKDQNNDLNSKNKDTLSFDEKEIQANRLNFIPTKPLKFSKEAEAVFEAGRKIWRYYHQNASDKDYNVNASLYDIKAHFQGRNSKGKMNNTSKDEGYNKLMSALNSALKKLAEKITPKIYEYGFLRE